MLCLSALALLLLQSLGFHERSCLVSSGIGVYQHQYWGPAVGWKLLWALSSGLGHLQFLLHSWISMLVKLWCGFHSVKKLNEREQDQQTGFIGPTPFWSTREETVHNGTDMWQLLPCPGLGFNTDSDIQAIWVPSIVRGDSELDLVALCNS